MGVIGLDLSWQGIGGMPGMLGRPRYQSKHTINANDQTLASTAVIEANEIVSAIFAAPMPPVAFALVPETNYAILQASSAGLTRGH